MWDFHTFSVPWVLKSIIIGLYGRIRFSFARSCQNIFKVAVNSNSDNSSHFISLSAIDIVSYIFYAYSSFIYGQLPKHGNNQDAITGEKIHEMRGASRQFRDKGNELPRHRKTCRKLQMHITNWKKLSEKVTPHMIPTTWGTSREDKPQKLAKISVGCQGFRWR